MTGSDTISPAVSAPPPERQRSGWRRCLDRGCRLTLAAVFLMAAVTKITDLQRFDDQVRLNAGLPDWLTLVVVRTLPWLELTCGLCLAAGYAVREAALIALFLLVLFLTHGMMHRAEPDCGCFLFPRSALSGPWFWFPLRCLLLLASIRLAWQDEPSGSTSRGP